MTEGKADIVVRGVSQQMARVCAEMVRRMFDHFGIYAQVEDTPYNWRSTQRALIPEGIALKCVAEELVGKRPIVIRVDLIPWDMLRLDEVGGLLDPTVPLKFDPNAETQKKPKTLEEAGEWEGKQCRWCDKPATTMLGSCRLGVPASPSCGSHEIVEEPLKGEED